MCISKAVCQTFYLLLRYIQLNKLLKLKKKEKKRKHPIPVSLILLPVCHHLVSSLSLLSNSDAVVQ